MHNAHAGHIGLQTVDTNVDHTRWPCVSHPPDVPCSEAVMSAVRRPPHTLEAANKVPARDWVDKR